MIKIRNWFIRNYYLTFHRKRCFNLIIQNNPFKFNDVIFYNNTKNRKLLYLGKDVVLVMKK